MGDQDHFAIMSLGERKIASPISSGYFKSDDEGVLFNIYCGHYDELKDPDGNPLSLEIAGPREKIYFDPSKVKAAIVTCGGLCPGINDVIRGIVLELYHRYQVRNIVGIRYGYRGLVPKYRHDTVNLDPEAVNTIHTFGGSMLSSSRGSQDIGEMVDALERMNISMLYCIGGDGTMRAAELLTNEIMRRGLKISIIGIPKTIDNDLALIQKSFGFDTAISEASRAVRCAHNEAKGALNGIGLVKLMGRQSGHIAAYAALALADVNFVLIPEIPFDLDGPNGFLKILEERLLKRSHAVVIVAEGAGQDFFQEKKEVGRDASGNIRLFDIGLLLKNRIEEYFQKINMEVNLKYFDPSYMIRSVAANASDSLFCGSLAKYAVHAGMAGKTGMVVGLVNDVFVHLPLKAVASKRKTVDPEGNIWMQVLETTGQPQSMKN